MANEEIILRIKTMMDNGDVKGAVSQMQSYFDKLKPSEELRGEFNKLFKDLIKEADQFETKMQGSFDKIGDVNSLKKTGDKISTIFSKIIKEMNKVSGSDADLSQFFDVDTSQVTKITKEIDQLRNKLAQVNANKIDSVEQSFKELLNTSKRAQGSNFFENFKSGDLDKASADFEKLAQHLTGFGTKSDQAKQAIRDFLSLLNSGEISSARENLDKLTQFGGAAGADSKLMKYANALVDIAEKLQEAKTESGEFAAKIEALDAQKVIAIANAMEKATGEVQQFKSVLNTADQGFDKLKSSANSAASSVQSFSQEVEELGSRATYFLSLENSVDLFRRGVQQAIETVKELDKAMTETAVVTDFTVGDMWEKLPEYSQMAKELGVEIKGVYEASTLYYQQGLQTQQVMALTTETLKMARIAGLECADATNLMTAALRGFNMEINEQSAQRVNDIYSELAAITAADTNEIATAMTKTASIASSANMELETTAALLAQMIETTREPAETAGTAMKTIIARFTEMKKATSDIVSVDGEEVSVNKVDAALASVGVQLKDVNGEFRDLDDVLLELAGKWNSLDIMSQRYIATTAAGSRQQSRFIAMMQNYERTMELVDAAYNSNGASATQFNKTQESLQSILARLSVAWDTFLMGIADDKIIKSFVKVITDLLEGFNKITEGADGLGGSIGRLIAVFTGLRVANAGIKGLMKYFVGLKGQIAGTTTKLTLLQALTQRINNFKMGNGFRTDVKVETGAAHGKIAALKADIKSLHASIAEPVVPTGTIIGFEALDKQLVITSITAEGTTESVELGLSEMGTKAILAAAAADGIGDELVESGLEGTFAMKVLEEQIEALNKDLALAKWLGDDVGAANIQVDIDNYTRDLNKLKKGNNAALSKGTKNMFGKSIKDSFKGLIKGAKGFFSALAPIAPLIAILVAEIGLLAAAWYFSPEQTLKRQIEDATAAAKSANEVFNNVNTSLDELTGYRTDLETIQDGFEGLAEGTSEWRSQLAKANALVLEIIRKYPDLAQYQTYGKNGQLDLTEEGWDQVIQKQSERAAMASTVNTISAARVDQLNSELTKYQDLEDKQDDLAGGWDEGLGWGLGTVGGVVGGAVGVSATTAGMLVGLWSGAISGSVVPVVGTIIGGLIGVIAGATMGYATSKVIQNSTEDSEEYQKYTKELEEKQKIERENRLQQYSAALYNEFSTDEEMGEDQNLGVATELMAERLETNLASTSSGLNNWLSDGADKDDIAEWAENLGYTVRNDKVYDQSGELVFKIEKTGDEHEGEEGWITDEQIAQQLAVQRATETTKEETEQLLGLMGDTETKLGLEEGDFSKIFLEEGLSGSSVRKLMKMDLNEVSTELSAMSEVTGQDMTLLMKNKKDAAEQYYKQLNTEMAINSSLYSQAAKSEDFDLKSYAAQFEEWVGNLSDERYSLLADQYNSILESAGAGAASIYVNALSEGFSKSGAEIDGLQQAINTIDFSNPIRAYAGLKQASENTNGSIKETIDSMLEAGEAAELSSGSQLRFYVNSEEFQEVNQALLEIKQTSGSISADNIYELAKENKNLRAMLDSGAIGAETLKVAIEGLNSGVLKSTDLTDNFVKALAQLNAVADITARAFDRIDNLNLSRSSAEIGKFYSDAKDEMLELYKMGAYGDSRLIDYMKHMLGEENWNKILQESGGDYKKAMSKYLKSIKDDSATMYSDWKDASSKLSFVSTDSSGNILFDFEKLPSTITTSTELIEHMANALGRSEEYVEAMIADMKTFSSDFEATYNAWGSKEGLNTLMSEASQYTTKDENGKTVLNYRVSRDQLSYFTDDIDGFISHFETEMSNENYTVKIDTEPLIDNGVWSQQLETITAETVTLATKIDLNGATKAIDSMFKSIDDKKLTFSDQGNLSIFANTLYNKYLNIGMAADEASEAVRTALSEKYDIYINDQALTDDILDATIQGLNNNAALIAAEEQAAAVGKMYYHYIYAAIINAIKLSALQMPENAAKRVTVNNKTYTTDSAEASHTHKGWYITDKATGQSAMPKYKMGTKQSDGTYKVWTGGEGSSNYYIVNPTTGTYDYYNWSNKDGYGTKTHSGTVNEDWEYSFKGYDENGAETTITYDHGAKWEDNPNRQRYEALDPYAAPDFTYHSDRWYAAVAAEADIEIPDNKLTEDVRTSIDEWYAKPENKQLVADKLASAYTTTGSRTPSDYRKGEDKDGDGIVDYEKESDRIKAKLDEIDSAIEDLADNDVTDMRLVNQLIEQKIALQREYKKTLEAELAMLDQSIPELWSRVQASGNDKYIKYNEETQSYGYTDAFYNDFFKNGVPIQSEELQERMEEVQDQVSQLNQVGSDQLSNQIAIKELVDNLVRNQGEDYNADRALKGKERRQTAADAEEQLIGRLPEEIQGPLMMLNTAEDAVLEYQGIQANKVLAENMQQELDATYAQVPDYVKEYLTFDEYAGYGIDLEKIYSTIQNPEEQDAMIERVMQNAEILNTKYDSLYEILEQLDGGKIQKAFHSISKVSKEFAKDLNKDEKSISKAFRELGEDIGFGADQLEGFGLKVEELIGDMDFKGVTDEETAKKITDKIKQSKIGGDIFSEEGLAGIQQLLTGGKGDTMLGAFGDVFGDLTGFAGDMFSFNMMNIGMDMFDNVKGMIDQGKQMIEKIVGYVVKATQVLVDAWTNREDYLYNFLQIIEKHLLEYEKLQRYSTQLEKGRLSSSQDILNNWNEQWKSLQQQLEEQTERLETRQKELDRSRWNPFSLISGWDPTSDTLYENREVKFIWDVIIGLGEAFAPFGTGQFFSQLNQLYEDYDKRVQQSYEDRLAAEQALLDIEDERLELVKVGADEATEFEQKLLDSMIQKEQEQIDELTRLNEAITDANSKLISTLQDNLDKMRQDRENEKREEELGEKERRLAYLRQDTSGANMLEIKKLEEELDKGHEDYTDTLIDQKISELEKQNELAAEQRQQQIDLLQGQLDYAEKYGLYWDAIYGMLYTFDENGNAILNPENFDLDGNIRENSQLAQMLGTFSDRLGMSVWSSVLDNEETKRLGRYYGAFIGMNGVDGNWANYWALKDPGANDPNYAYPEQEIPDGLWGVLYRMEINFKKYFANSDPDLVNRGGRLEQSFKNFFGKLFGNEEWANYEYEGANAAHVQSTTFAGMKKISDDITAATTQGWENFKGLFTSKTTNNTRAADMGRATTEKAKSNMNNYGTQNYGAVTENYNFNIGTVGENISLDDMVDRVSSAIRGLFTSDGVGGLQKKR